MLSKADADSNDAVLVQHKASWDVIKAVMRTSDI